MRVRLRSRILLNFVMIIIVFAVVGAVVGVVFIDRTTVHEEQRRVSFDLRSAWSVLQGRLEEMSILVSVLSTGKRVSDVFDGAASQDHRVPLEAVRRQFNLDFLSLTDDQGRVIMRTVEPYHTGDNLSLDPFVANALKGKAKKGYYVLSAHRLAQEGAGLAERAFMVFEPTNKAKLRSKTSESAGLVMVAAIPVCDVKGRVLGTLYAGVLMNRNFSLVDRIHNLVFEGQLLDGKPVGTVTIFQWDVRVATNVVLPNGNRALGTRVSSEVYDRVLENNQSWCDRAFVVNEWYISAYEPMHDVDGKVVGILYVGVLAKKYDEIRISLWKIYGWLSLAAVILVALLGVVFSRRITGQVSRIAEASGRIAEGQLDLTVPEPRADDELKDLTKAFNTMAERLHDRDERLKLARRELEETNAELNQVNQNYLGMLGFVSHELKNTLGVIYTSAKALDACMVGPLNEAQAKLAGGISRNIEAAVSMTRQYLDLTRVERGELSLHARELDLVGEVIAQVLDELKPTVEERGARVLLDLPAKLTLPGDPDLLKVVFRNLLDNALKYGQTNGEIRVSHRAEENGHVLEVWNRGPGLAPEQMAKLFTKFQRFNTGEMYTKGTGLGLFLTREIIHLHGGDVRAESQEGSWMKFIITLPAS